MASVSRMFEELIAQPLALARTGHQSGDVDEFDDGRDDALGLYDAGEFGQARVGDFDHAHVGFDGAEGVVGRFDPRFGKRVEEGGFADVG